MGTVVDANHEVVISGSVIGLGARSQESGGRGARCAQDTDDWLQIADYFEQTGEAPGAVWTQVFWLQDSDSWLLN